MGCCGQVKTAITAAGAVKRVVVAAMDGRPVRAGHVTIKERTQICKACPDYIAWERNPLFHKCGICGCWLDGKYLSKLNLATERCPAGKWEASP